ncbi:MAG: DUF2079 domain-containing protein [Porphyrobacter sp.]|jgi:hypothetical protein|nr:DUF2079 domain-containing protein [Porphyrobacter sp.]
MNQSRDPAPVSPDSPAAALRPRGVIGVLAARLMGADGAKLGGRLVMGATALTCVVFLTNAFVLEGAAYAIQDDARQFLAWTVRLADPAALKGDLIADYWNSVTPLALRGIYGAFAIIGVSPLVLARLIPVMLLVISALATWRIALQLTGGRALAALITAGLTLALLVHEDSIFTATARAFSPPLFLLFVDGLLREKRWQMVVSLGVLAAIYPTTALVGLTMLGLSYLRRQWPLPVELTRQSITTVLAATLAVGAPIALVPGEVSRWEPVMTIADALTMPNLATPGGRSSIVPMAGTPAWLCSARVGMLPEIFPCWASRWATLVNLLLLTPLLFLGIRGGLRTWQGGPKSGDVIYLWATIAGVAWWGVATIFAFKLHLPARYPQRVLSILEFMAIGQIIGQMIDTRLRTAAASGAAAKGARAALAVWLGLFALSFATPTPGIRRPADPGAIDWIMAASPDLRIGGLSADLDFVPAVTGRSTHVTIEHAIPYHLTYFREIDRRLKATLAAFTTPDAVALARFVTAEKLDVLLIDRAFIADGTVPKDYAGVIAADVAQGEAALARAPSALQRAAQSCALYRGPGTWVIDAKCLAEPPPAP